MKCEGAALQNPLVSIVDDDPSIRNSTGRLIRSFGFQAEAFGSAGEFLAFGNIQNTACLILDVRMPGMNGLELQDILSRSHLHIPIVFVTAHASDGAEAQAATAGAVDVLRKPVGQEALVNAIQIALGQRRQQETQGPDPERPGNS